MTCAADFRTGPPQGTYIPGHSATVREADGRVLASVQKVHLDCCSTGVQRSLLVTRESLRQTTAADVERFCLKSPEAGQFWAQRTYPGVEVEIFRGASEGVTVGGQRVARMSRRDYLQLSRVRLCVARF